MLLAYKTRIFSMNTDSSTPSHDTPHISLSRASTKTTYLEPFFILSTLDYFIEVPKMTRIFVTIVAALLFNGNVSSGIPWPKQPGAVCVFPGTPSNGEAKFTQPLIVGSVVTFRCDEGFTLVGAIDLVCQSSGQWTDSQPECQPLRCANLDPIANGSIIGSRDSYLIGDEVKYTCDDGFIMEGDEIVKCVARESLGSWRGKIPTCQPGLAKLCPKISPPQNGALVCGISEGAMFCSGRCNSGYEFSASVVLFECSSRTQYQWSAEANPCIEELFLGFRLESDVYYLESGCADLSFEQRSEVEKGFEDVVKEERNLVLTDTHLVCGCDLS
ncbi:hypothetical protein CAPTEDRAFT_155529 [Capitella teleta]|uniref:Sushi domain-containing protein n=1 Tax=Capitella teleta TaxID=283909 RepID=R7TEZ7_CAPTE|nr:hypothetical protein CAPTEDRAFT_155529 [Capitella teleta]|eukprot:ELT92308.1 hypothetical protein CAPTEDRAFT_155529 [Capitella teleta]